MLVAEVTWAAALSAVGALITPLAVVVIGFLLNRKLKRIEERQWRSQELIAARLAYYREIAEPLNDLLCYFTFIGAWKEWTPVEIVELKRSLDKTFHTLVPFFSEDVVHSYNTFMRHCFETFGQWGVDAKLKTSCRRRREVSRELWKPEWELMYTYVSDELVPPDELERIKEAYNEVLARLIGDIQLTDSRTNYATAHVVLNA